MLKRLVRIVALTAIARWGVGICDAEPAPATTRGAGGAEAKLIEFLVSHNEASREKLKRVSYSFSQTAKNHILVSDWAKIPREVVLIDAPGDLDETKTQYIIHDDREGKVIQDGDKRWTENKHWGMGVDRTRDVTACRSVFNDKYFACWYTNGASATQYELSDKPDIAGNIATRRNDSEPPDYFGSCFGDLRRFGTLKRLRQTVVIAQQRVAATNSTYRSTLDVQQAVENNHTIYLLTTSMMMAQSKSGETVTYTIDPEQGYLVTKFAKTEMSAGKSLRTQEMVVTTKKIKDVFVPVEINDTSKSRPDDAGHFQVVDVSHMVLTDIAVDPVFPAHQFELEGLKLAAGTSLLRTDGAGAGKTLVLRDGAYVPLADAVPSDWRAGFDKAYA